MRSNGCTRSSNEGSGPRPCCRLQTPLPCWSGRCLPPAKSTCARSMAGRHSPQSPLISRLTLQPETIPSCYRRSRHTEFQPHPGRHLDELKQLKEEAARKSKEDRGALWIGVAFV